jgi:hypothetical protein
MKRRGKHLLHFRGSRQKTFACFPLSFLGYTRAKAGSRKNAQVFEG